MKPLLDPHKFPELRQRAEKLVEITEEDLANIGLGQLKVILHDLAVHQIELEMQNNELHQAYADLDEARKRAEQSRDRFFQLFNLAPISYLTLDARGIIRECNQAFLNLIQFDERKLIGRTLMEFVDPKDRFSFDVQFKSLVNGSQKGNLEFRIADKYDKQTYLSLAVQPLNNNLQDVELLVALTDISDIKEAEKVLKLSAAVFDIASEGVLITDPDNKIIAVNRAFTEITGYDEDEVIGKTPKILMSGQQSDSFYFDIWDSINSIGHWHGEIWNKRKNGEIYPEWLSINVLRDEQGKILRHIGVFTDITQQKHAEEVIRRQANYDFLTKLPNRLLFFDRLGQEIRNVHRTGLHLALMYIDLDYFKEVNDSFGHDIGDLLLKEVAGRLTGSVRSCDTVCRLSGDEFTVILSDLSNSYDVEHVAQDMLSKLVEPFILNSNVARISASIGIAFYPDDATGIDELIKCADQAMYQAKKSSRNNYCFFSDK